MLSITMANGIRVKKMTISYVLTKSDLIESNLLKIRMNKRNFYFENIIPYNTVLNQKIGY